MSMIVDEILLAVCLLPLLVTDFRIVTCGTATGSDAAEDGGAVSVATGITGMGIVRLGRASRGAQAPARDRLALVESFGGISASRAAPHWLGITPALHLHYETSEEAVRLLDKTIQMPSVLKT